MNLTVPEFPDAQIPDAAPIDTSSSFQKGLKSSWTGVKADASALGGRLAETVGLDSVGQGLYNNAAALQAQAQAEGPTVDTLDKVHGLRDAYNYATGQIGKSAPMLAAGLVGGLAGRGRLGGIAGATAATLPFTAGEQVLSQQADPEQAQRSVGLRNLVGGGVALGQAAAMNVVPQLVGGKLIGRGVEHAAYEGLGATVAKNVGEAVGGNALAGAGSEALAQQGASYLNPNRDTSQDQSSLAEAAGGGAALGGIFAPLGIAGDRFARRGMKPAGGIDLDAGNKAAPDAPGAPPVDPQAPADPAAPAAPASPIQRAADLGRTAYQAFRDVVSGKRDAPTDLDAAKTMAEGGDLVNEDALAAAPPGSPQATEIVRQGAADAFNKAKTWATELAKEKLTPENQAKLAAAAQDLGSKVSQATIAGLKIASDGLKTAMKKADAVKSSIAAQRELAAYKAQRRTPEQLAAMSPADRDAYTKQALSNAFDPNFYKRGSTDSMFSESTEGGRLKVANALKEITGDNETAQVNASSTADVIDAMQTGVHLGDKEWAKIVDQFGPDAYDVLSGVHDKIFPNQNARRTKFYEALAGLDEYVKNQTSLEDTVTSSVLPEHQDDLSPPRVRALVQHLKEFVRGDHTSDVGPAEAKQKNDRFKALLQETFGDKTDDVLARFAKEAKNSDKLVNDRQFGEKAQESFDTSQAGVEARERAAEERGQLTEGKDFKGEFEQSRYYGGGRDKKNPTFVESPEVHRENYGSDKKGPAEQLHEQATRENPDRTVDYISARDYAAEHGLTDEQLSARTKGRPDDYVMVEARGQKLEGRLTKPELDRMKLDTDRFGNSKSRIDTPVTGVTLDAKRLLQVMREKNPTLTASDEKGWMQRTARLFFEGIGAASDSIGERIGLNDNGLVVARKGGKEITLGDLKKVKFGPEGVDPAVRDEPPGSPLDRTRTQFGRSYGDQPDGPALHTEGLTDKHGNYVLEATGKTDKHGNPIPFESSRQIQSSTTSKAVLENRLSKLQLDMDKLITRSRALSDKEKAGTLTGRDRFELKKNREKYREMMQVEGYYQKAVDSHAESERKASNREEAAREIGPDEQIHTAADALGEADLVVKQPTSKQGDKPELLKNVGTDANADWQVTALGREAIEGRIKSFEAGKSAAMRNIGSMARQLDKIFGRLQETEQFMMAHFASEKNNVEAAQMIKDLAKDHGIVPQDFKGKKAEPAAKTVADLVNAGGESLKKVIDRAATSTDLKALQAAVDTIADSPSKHSAKALDAINARLDTLTENDPAARYQLLLQREGGLASNLLDETPKPKGKAKPVESPLTDAQKAEMKRLDDMPMPDMKSDVKTDPNQTADAAMRDEVAEHIRTVLGDSVQLAWDTLLSGPAGSFTKRGGLGGKVLDLIRLSTHALEPHSVAAHEAWHAFMSQLRDSGDHEINRVIFKAADSAAVRAQLEKHFANEPEVLKQIRSTDGKASEERAAYMYQMWADPNVDFKVGTKTEGVFGKIAKFVRDVLGLWTNDDRATHIMDYFQSGEYAKNIGDRSKITSDLSQGAGNEFYKQAKALSTPIRKLANTVAGVGEARLRDTGIPALKQIADLIHTPTSGRAEGGDTGYLNASRVQYSRSINELSKDLGGIEREHLDAAWDALQSGKRAASPEAQKAQDAIRKSLDQAFAHMKEAGVNIGDLGPDYAPRVWDTATLTRRADAFKAMIQKYVDSGALKKLDADQVLSTLISNQGSEVGIESLTPGMQHAKQRVFDFISAEDAAPYLSKDLHGTMNSYLQQAARRAEWTRRFGEVDTRVPESERMPTKLDKLRDQAVKDGATAEDLKLASRYLNGVNGTLGDTIPPWQRKFFANSIVYENVRLLSLGIFSSAPDAAGIFVRGGTVSDAFDTFKRGIKEVGRGFKNADNQKEDAKYRLAEDLGVIENAMLQHTVGSAYSQDLAGFAKKVNEGFFKFNLMDQYNRSMRVGATIAASKFIAKHADGAYSRHSTRWLDELGLKPGDVEFKGKDARDPDGLGLGVEGRADNRDPLLTKQDFVDAGYDDKTASAKSNVMAAAVNKWVDGAILRPNAAQKPIWFNDPHFALISHLKQFVYSFQENILKRVVNEAKHGNYMPAAGLASYVPIMLAADFAKGMIQGGGSQPDWKEGWGAADYLWAAAQRSGLFGVAQFGIDSLEHQSGAIGLLGPTIEQLAQGVAVAGGKARFGSFAIKSMPANSIASLVAGGAAAGNGVGPDPTFAD